MLHLKRKKSLAGKYARLKKSVQKMRWHTTLAQPSSRPINYFQSQDFGQSVVIILSRTIFLITKFWHKDNFLCCCSDNQYTDRENSKIGWLGKRITLITLWVLILISTLLTKTLCSCSLFAVIRYQEKTQRLTVIFELKNYLWMMLS